jgi:phospholipase/carboxylesterase
MLAQHGHELRLPPHGLLANDLGKRQAARRSSRIVELRVHKVARILHKDAAAVNGAAAPAADSVGYARMLETIEIDTAPNPDAAVIWMHGLGADGHDFEPVVPEIVRGRERAWRFVFPNAPVRPVSINNGMNMRAWYDILGFEPGTAEDAAGFRATDKEVSALIGREIERGIAPGRVILAGFSQGGAVTLYTGLRYPQRLAGLMVLSSYLPMREALQLDRAPANQGVPIFMAHGIDDPVLPMTRGLQSRDFLKAQGYDVEWHQYRMPHSVSEAEIADIRHFLFRVLP